MPIINTDDYKPPFWLPGGQSQTIFPSIFRKVEGVNYVRERVYTQDGDFIDIDLSKHNSIIESSKFQQFNNSIIILSHGLEGDTSRQYITGMVKNLVVLQNVCSNMG